jgi:coenzyme F420 hydrogenase subunit beta
MRSIKSLKDIVEWNLCVGCGACYSVCEKGAVELIQSEHMGIKPRIQYELCKDCTECLHCCPGYQVDSSLIEDIKITSKNDDRTLIGPTLEIWEGFATEKEIRYRGSSGGILSAISLYCIEKEGFNFVLHTAMDMKKPWLNRTVISHNLKELLDRCGSRYAASSPCDSLKLIEESSKPCVFIGKPCDAAAVQALRKVRSKLDKNLGIVLTFCCAGVPSTKGSLDLLDNLNINKKQISHITYRGDGWPGGFTVKEKSGLKKQYLTYIDSWHFLQKYRPFRCKICPDGLGQVSDISCGDAWHKYTNETDNLGLSLVMVRSRRGQEILHKATESGYLTLYRSDSKSVIQAQGLVKRRMEIFGRQMAMKLLMIPTTKYIGFKLLHSCIKAPLITKIKSFLGTFRRLLQKGLWHRSSKNFY